MIQRRLIGGLGAETAGVFRGRVGQLDDIIARFAHGIPKTGVLLKTGRPGLRSARAGPESYTANRRRLHRVDNRDLLDREVGNDLDFIVVDNQHFLDPDTILVCLSVLGFQGEDHAFLDLDRVVE